MKKPTIKIVKFYQSLDPSSCMRVKVGSVEGKHSEWLTNYKRKKKIPNYSFTRYQHFFFSC